MCLRAFGDNELEPPFVYGLPLAWRHFVLVSDRLAVGCWVFANIDTRPLSLLRTLVSKLPSDQHVSPLKPVVLCIMCSEQCTESSVTYSASPNGWDRNSASQPSLGAPFSPDLSLVPARVTPFPVLARPQQQCFCCVRRQDLETRWMHDGQMRS